MFPLKASNVYTLLRWTPPVNTTLSPPPLGSLELAVGLDRHHSHQWLRRTVWSTWCTFDGHFYGQGAHQPITPGLSGVGLASPPTVFDSLSASETGITAWVLPYALYGQGDQKKCVHVRVCVCVCVCVCDSHRGATRSKTSNLSLVYREAVNSRMPIQCCNVRPPCDMHAQKHTHIHTTMLTNI